MSIMKELTPKEIVSALDKYIIGQNNAKKSIAIALRNRWRRQQVEESMREEILPNNIILIGPTGVGKTEIARRLARLANAPFVKVEASKFTEVGYVGRDVESMIRDLVDISVSMVKQEKTNELQEKAKQAAEERILDILLPSFKSDSDEEKNREIEEKRQRTREKMRNSLKEGKLDSRTIEIDAKSDQFPTMQIFSPMGLEEMGINIQEMFGGMMPKKMKKRKMSVKDAKKYLTHEEAQKLIDMDAVVNESIKRVENSGIVFVDEIDKVAGQKSQSGPDVSREGVQRDILPVVEGTTIVTKYGPVKTDHILFIAAGAFHMSKPSDLIPELQGRFPIRVELSSLSEEDFERILVEPQNALIKQYTAIMKTENIDLQFNKGAIKEIAKIAVEVNNRTENIGARRLHTVLTTLLEDILYNAPELEKKRVTITAKYVKEKLDKLVTDEDLSRYIL